MIHTGKLARAELCDRHACPYTDVRSVYESNKDRFPARHLVVTNAHWYAPGQKPCGNYKVSGQIISREYDSALGFVWSDDQTPVISWSDMSLHDNFLGIVPAIVHGARQDVSGQTAGVRRPCPRTWWGFDAAGACTVEATVGDYTLAQIIDHMEDLGIKDGVVLDGSGSSQWFDGNAWIRGDGRTVFSFLLLWFEGEEDKKMDRKTVCLDAGHGGTDRQNGAPDGSYKEHEFTLDVALRVQKLLKPYIDVVMTRASDTTVSLDARAAIANKSGADCYVSLHSNAAAGSGWADASGLCVYTSSAGDTAGRNVLAGKLLESFRTSGVGIFGQGLYHSGFAVLVKTNMPACLIEYGFHTDREDVTRLKSDAWRDRLAQATAAGILEYLGIEHKEPAEDKIYRVQLGAFSEKANAEGLRAKLVEQGYEAFIREDT